MTAPTSSSSPMTTPPVSSNRSRRWLRRLALLVATFAILLADIAVGATLLVRGAYPRVSGTTHLAGPRGAITVARDPYGVPHITAQNSHDLFFAQGYVTAQDRLWQMEFNRRVAAGRLAEIFGESVVDADKFLRTLGLGRSAQADVDRLTPDLRAQLDAYTQGVNAFLANNGTTLPLEFRVLGFTPEPWTDADSIAYGKVVAYDLDGSWNIKLARAQVLSKVGPDLTALLFPAYPADNPTLIDRTGRNQIPPGSASAPPPAPTSPTSALLQALPPALLASFQRLGSGTTSGGVAWLRDRAGQNGAALASNDWVVAGSHTTTGKPLLANDPHLGIQYPAIWYEVALRSTDPADHYDAVGYSFPGVPGIIIGHNANIAWGVTNGMVDDTDLYIEQLTSDRSAYRSGNIYVPLEQRDELIAVKGGTPVHMTVRTTPHGPLLNDVLGPDFADAPPIALQWTALQPEYSFAGFFMLGAARNWNEFEEAVRHIDISQNFVFADTLGNIGYRLSGWLPIRPLANGLVPVNGADGMSEWKGRVPFDAMPHLFNPASGIILTANNQITPPDYPYFITNDWDLGFRASRIESLLTAKPQLSPDDFAAIQLDVTSVPAKQITPFYLRAAQSGTGTGSRALRQLLTGWDGSMTRASAATALYEVTTSRLITDLTKPLLGEKIFKQWDENAYADGKFLFIRDQLAAGSLLCTSVHACDSAVQRAADEAVAYLTQRFGTSDPTAWHWGAMHAATFAHPLAAVSPLDKIFPIQSVSRPGDTTTVNVGGAGGFTHDDYRQRSLPSMRQIIDLGDFDASRFVTTTGESGLPMAPHNFDLLALWDSGGYQPMPFTPAAVQSAAVEVLTLAP